MDWLIWQMVWWGTAASVIAVDSQMRKNKKDAGSDSPDLSDKAVWPWLIVAAVAGALLFPIYFYNTRKTIVAGVIGLAMVPVFYYIVLYTTAQILIALARFF